MHMNRQSAGLGLLLVALSATNASAHHVMGGRMPATFMDGLLSGLGHPIIGIDHFAAVVAVGCLAATHNAAPTLVIGFIAAMMAGVTLHLHGASVPAAELLVAVTVIALGALLVGHRQMPTGRVLTLFALVGLVHGYALGESIYGAEPTPIYAYLIGLGVVQGAIALVAVKIARGFAGGPTTLSPLRLVGAGIAGVGLAVLVQQVVPTV
jgi:urease accessory protein